MEHYGFSDTFACASSNCRFCPMFSVITTLHRHSCFGKSFGVFIFLLFFNCEQYGNVVFFFFSLPQVGGKSGFHPSAAVAGDLGERAASFHIHQIEKKQEKKAVRLIDILCHVCSIS